MSSEFYTDNNNHASTAVNSNGWKEHAKLVMSLLRQHSDDICTLQGEGHQRDIKIAILQVKCGMIAGFVSFLFSAGVSILVKILF